MNKFMIVLAATTAVTVSVPAAAQYNGANVQLRVSQLQTELQAGVRSGDISRSEAVPLRQQLRQLAQLERQYSVNGISGRERADLQHRINTLRQGIRFAARDRGQGYDRNDDRYDRNDDRYDRNVDSRYDRNNDGWDDRDGNRDGRWDVDSRYDSNRDGWDDRDHDRDGRWDDDDDRYDRDQVSGNGNRGLIGTLIDSVTGGGGLRVGQRASANLGAVPYEYRSQFRDGNGAYYRSDGRQIYQIDARTHAVVRIFAMNR